MTIYQKPYLTLPDQVSLLEQRGMIVTDRAKAEDYLAHIGYYRLSAYWYSCRSVRRVLQPDGSTAVLVEDNFKPGTDFQIIVDLYVFDKHLRLLMLDVLERIEISLRTAISLQLGKYDPCAYRDSHYLDGKFVNHRNPNSSHAVWLQRFDDKAGQSKESFADHFRTKYPHSDFPIWIAVEMLDFGPLSHLLGGMRFVDQRDVATLYSIPRPDLMTSWVRTLCVVRNTCAHHARLWNKPLVDQPKLPRQGEMPYLDHLLAYRAGQKRLYAAAAISQFILRIINPQTGWPERLKAHVATFPTNPHVSFSASGFPMGWENEPLWQP